MDATVKACAAPADQRSLQDSATLVLLKQVARPTQPNYNLKGELVFEAVVRTRKGSEFVSPSAAAELAA